MTSLRTTSWLACCTAAVALAAGNSAFAQNGTRNINDQQPNADQRVRLGVQIQESPTTGVYIAQTMQGGPAANSGIRAGDYILSINNTSITSPQAFRQAMNNLNWGDQTEIVVWRNDKKQTLTVRLPKESFVHHSQQQNGHVNGRSKARAWLGVQMTSTTKGKQGVQIAGVYPSGPAAIADLEVGDQLISVNGQPVNSPGQLAAVISRKKPNDEVKLVVLRDGQEETLTATLANASDFIDVSQLDGAPRTANGLQGDYYGEPSEHAMMLQQHRHMAMQHERIEKLVLELKQEIQELRKELKARNVR